MNLLEELQSLVADPKQVSTGETILDQHSRAVTYYPPHRPDVVVFPQTKEEISRIVAFANQHRVPIVPFAAGSSLEGQIIPVQGGISMNMMQMNQILEIRPDDFLVRVQPGVTRNQLNEELKKYGLFFPVDPGADASIGGMAATNASGTNSVRYGVMRDSVLGLEVVLANGQIIRTGGMSFKSSSGYHLTGMFVGSEGTLGVITEITLKVYGIPEVILAAKACFSSIDEAGRTAEALLKSGIPIGKMELVDERTIRAVNAYKKTNYIEAPTLFLEFNGSKTSVDHDVEIAREIAEHGGVQSFEFETDSLARAMLWEARHHVAFAIKASAPAKGLVSTDVCVPISELTNAIVETRRIVDQYGMASAIFGHVGDGNYHAVLSVDESNPEEIARMEEINSHIVDYALKKGGTCTGEHGIGLGKKKYLRQEHGDAVDIMMVIKHSLDPHGIFNPGKIFE